MATDGQIRERVPIQIRLPQSAAMFGEESFTLTLMHELAEQASLFEPELMRIAGGWLAGPVDVHVISCDIENSMIEIMLTFRFATHQAPGCGTSAVASDHDLPVHLRIDRATGAAVLSI